MELHAASVQALQLLPCTSMLTLRNSALLCAACLRLCRMHHSAGTLHDTFAPRDSTITWRPKYCKDVFLFLSADTDAVVVGMAQTDTTEFFTAQDATAPHPFVDEACTVFAHLTCDVHEDRSAQMVLLCYDVLEHQKARRTCAGQDRHLDSAYQAVLPGGTAPVPVRTVTWTWLEGAVTVMNSQDGRYVISRWLF